jgi:hypothetical protein
MQTHGVKPIAHGLPKHMEDHAQNEAEEKGGVGEVVLGFGAGPQFGQVGRPGAMAGLVWRNRYVVVPDAACLRPETPSSLRYAPASATSDFV